MPPHPKGSKGEDFAAKTLAEQGYRILARNHHSRFGEVDLVAQKDDIICFVEVKTRRQGSIVSAAQAVGRAKQRKIIATALLYLQQHPKDVYQPRFDVFTVLTDGRGTILSYDYIMGAFDGEAYEHGTAFD